MTNKTNKKTH